MKIPKTVIPLAVGVFILFMSGNIIAALSEWRVLVVPIPVTLFFVLFLVVGWLISVYFQLYVRDKSKTVITDSGLRESARGLTPKCDVDQGGEPWPAQEMYIVGGGAAAYFATRGKHALMARKTAIERLGEDTLIVYAPTQPLPGFFVKGLAMHEADQLARGNDTKFVATVKSGSILHYSLLDSLHGIDSQALRQKQAFIVNRHGRSGAEEADRVRMGFGAIIQDFKGLAASARSQTKRESVRKFFTGPARGSDTEDEQEADKDRVQ